MHMNSCDEKSDNGHDDNFIPNPKELNGVPDLSQLVYLEMKHVLHNLHYRYSFMKSKHCYTSISTILVAINPYERLPIYGEDVIKEFSAAANKGRLLTERPHPYGVSARSYMRMIQRKKNQSIIVCGESGAGKTETTKLLMRYLAMTAPSSSMEASIVEQQIIAASPILEAYGNAKTVMNNNSSRFGKFTKLLYDVESGKEGYILGSYLETYLLEKSRVVFQSSNERNYHIFYFLQQGLQKDKNNNSLFDSLFVEKHKCDDYWYTNQGKTSVVTNVNDVNRFVELKESLGLMRIGDEMQPDLWRLTCGIINLGNIEFIKKDDGFASINMKKCKKYVTQVASLWGIKEESLIKRLTTANVKVVNNTIEKQINFKDAVSNRDSIAKGIYAKIFLWLVQRINAELYQTESDDSNNYNDDMSNVLFIGILDVFGFENFYNNSLEQFCINFTNEKLQQYFNFHIIRSEQEEYIKESVFWKPLSIPDNLEYVKMVEDTKTGFFTILDSSCKVAKPDPVQFMQELFKHHGKNSTIKKANKRGVGRYRGGPVGRGGGNRRGGRGKNAKFIGFTINHFADEVAYDAASFLVKNMESVHPDTAKMFNKSNYLLAKQIGGTKGAACGKKRRKKLTVTGTFSRGIKTLMRNLKATEPFFVRCVNPNTVKSKTVWTESVVEHQLRCGGLVEALKVLKLGYPTRVPYQDLYDRYHSTVTNPLIKNMKAEEFATVLLIAFDVSEDDYELGLTKIFFKPSKAAVLDTIMAQAGQPLSKEQNEKITKWIVNKRVKQMIGLTKTFLQMRKRIRLVRAQQEWEWSGRVASIVGGTVVRHLGIARARILKRKQEEAAAAMQTLFRANYERAYYVKHIETVKKAAKMVWISYRCMEDRKQLRKWLDAKVEETKEIRRLKADEAAKVEAQRIEDEKKRFEDEEKQRIADEKERLEKQAALEEKKKQDAIDLEREKELRISRQNQESIKIKKQDMEKEKTERLKEKQSRENGIKLNKMSAEAEDEQIAQEKLDKKITDNFPELSKFVGKHGTPRSVTSGSSGAPVSVKQGTSVPRDDDDEDGGDDDLGTDEDYETDSDDINDDNYDLEKNVSEQLKYFHKTAQIGQLFLKYAGKRRRKPQDRIVKVTFDSKKEAIRISWGSGSRHIDFDEIQYVAYGHYTPVFEERKDVLDEKLCVSVVGKNQILDIQAYSIETALVWVRGLRILLNHNEKVSNEMAEKNLKSGNLNKMGKNSRSNANKIAKQQSHRVLELMKLQQDLFIMTTATVIRNLDQEGIWEIDQNIKEEFNSKTMYEEALKKDIPWREWSDWIRNKIVTHLREKQLAQQRRQQQLIQPQPYWQPNGNRNRSYYGNNNNGVGIQYNPFYVEPIHGARRNFVPVNNGYNYGRYNQHPHTFPNPNTANLNGNGNGSVQQIWTYGPVAPVHYIQPGYKNGMNTMKTMHVMKGNNGQYRKQNEVETNDTADKDCTLM